MYCSFFIHSSSDGHLGCFQILAIVNNTAMNVGVCIFFWISVLGFFGYVSRSGITVSKGSFTFNFLRKFRTAFHSGCTDLHPHQQCTRFLLSTSSPALVVCWFIDDSHSDRCEVIFHCGMFAFLWRLVKLSIFSYVSWPSAFPLWGSVYLGPILIF